MKEFCLLPVRSETMAEDAIGKAGLYFDELNKIRVLEPEVAVQTNDLKDECKDFLESEFNKVLIGGYNAYRRIRVRLRCFIHRLISPMHQTCTRLLLNSSVDLLRVIKLRC